MNGNDIQLTTFDSVKREISTTVPEITVSLGISNSSFAVIVENVNKTYGKGASAVFGLNGINMRVPEGCIYGLLGPSGCGKTSLLRCILGCASFESGEIRVFGHQPFDSGSDIPGPAVGYMPQDIALHDDLTIKEMLTYFGRLYYLTPNEMKQAIVYLITVLDLPEPERLIGQLSGGQRRRVSFACAIIHRPKLLILDEPTVGVDPILRERIWDILVRSAEEEKTTVIITTHYIEETKRSHYVGFMRRGFILAEDAPQTLIERYDADSLEDVFYKLCVQQKNQPKFMRSSLKEISQKQSFKKKSNPFTNFLLGPKAVFKCSPKKVVTEWHMKVTTLTWKIMIQFFRQQSALIAQFVIPLISLFIFYFCVGGTPIHVPLAVVNEENPPYLSQMYIDSINKDVIKVYNFTSFQEAFDAVKRTDIWGILHIRTNFSEALLERTDFPEDIDDETINEGTLKLYADLTNSVLKITLQRALEDAIRSFSRKALISLEYNPRVLDAPIKVEEAIFGVYSESDYFALRDFSIPGLMIILTYTIAYALTVLLLMAEKSDQMFERNFVAGVSSTQIIVAHLMSRVIFMSVNVIGLFTLSFYVFNVPTRGPVFWAFLLLLLQSVAGLTNGMVISAFCSSFYNATILSNGVLLFIFITSGVLWTVETQPYWVQWMSSMMPTTIPTRSLRCILSRGLGITSPRVYHGFIVTIGYTVIFFLLTVFLFRKSK